MSRVAKKPVLIPKGVEVSIDGQLLKVKGPQGELVRDIHQHVEVVKTVSEEGDGLEVGADVIKFKAKHGGKDAKAQSGTSRSLVNNMVTGVSQGFQKELELHGVGYRAALKGKVIELTLGFSHPVLHNLPEGITAELPSNTRIVIKGIDKQLVGQVASEIRDYRPPEPYKGKGVRYAGEHIRRKEAKKK